MSTFSRLRYVIAANANALIEKAEDPDKLLRALIREMEDAGEEARQACAELLAEQGHAERARSELEQAHQQWLARAERAVEQHRDDLARQALQSGADVQARLDAVNRDLAVLQERRELLEGDMGTLKGKLADAKSKLAELQQRTSSGNSSKARPQSPVTRSERRIQRALNRFEGLQAQVENLEARVASYDVGGHAPARVPAVTNDDPEIEQALAELKQRIARQSPAGTEQASREA